MKKVLLIAYYYYKKEMVASNRTHAIFDHLSEYGYDVTLITSKSERQNVELSDKIIPVPNDIGFLKIYFKLTKQNSWGLYNDKFNDKYDNGSKSSPLLKLVNAVEKLVGNSKYLERVLSELYFLFSMIYFPDLSSGWYKPALNAGLKELAKGGYSAIISTSGPFTAHKVANKLHKKTGVPWIADYRDLWSQREVTSFYVPEKRKRIEKDYEKSIIADCNLITTVSEPLANVLNNLHKKNVEVITNGFDPKFINKQITVDKKLNITYTGSIYSAEYDGISLLFESVRSLIDEGMINSNDLDIKFYGPYVDWLDEEVKMFNLDGSVRQLGMVSKYDAINAQRSSQILLLLLWNGDDGEGIYTGKLFEYLAAKRPILALGRKSYGVDKILREVNSGVTAQDADEMKSVLLDWYNSYKKLGYVPYLGDETEIYKYSYCEMARKFSELLDKF